MALLTSHQLTKAFQGGFFFEKKPLGGVVLVSSEIQDVVTIDGRQFCRLFKAL
jgi:hypothetical protein